LLPLAIHNSPKQQFAHLMGGCSCLAPLLVNSRYYFQPRAGADRREF